VGGTTTMRAMTHQLGGAAAAVAHLVKAMLRTLFSKWINWRELKLRNKLDSDG
jgi:hypothetical protein